MDLYVCSGFYSKIKSRWAHNQNEKWSPCLLDSITLLSVFLRLRLKTIFFLFFVLTFFSFGALTPPLQSLPNLSILIKMWERICKSDVHFFNDTLNVHYKWNRVGGRVLNSRWWWSRLRTVCQWMWLELVEELRICTLLSFNLPLTTCPLPLLCMHNPSPHCQLLEVNLEVTSRSWLHSLNTKVQSLFIRTLV